MSYAPVSYTPSTYVSYYTPTVASYAPAAYVTSYAPVTPYVSYYSPYAVSYAPVASPYAVYYGVAGWSVYGTPKVYVPGEPVRNSVRALTP